MVQFCRIQESVSTRIKPQLGRHDSVYDLRIDTNAFLNVLYLCLKKKYVMGICLTIAETLTESGVFFQIPGAGFHNVLKK